MTILAWHGEPGLKTAAMKRLHEHRSLDRIAQKVYWRHGRGCLLGCLTHSDNDSHREAERLFGIELGVGYWMEAVFEGLPTSECAQWVIDSADAIPVGADLSQCHNELSVWLLGPDGPMWEGASDPLVRDAVAAVRECHTVALAGGSPDFDAAWSSAELAARSAAESARSARSAAWAARSAAESARSARSAAWAAAESATWSAWSAARSAESATWRSIAAKSIEIFRAAPVPGGTSECPECVTEAMIVLRDPIGAMQAEVTDDR